MASFTESATLIVRDQASKPIGKINAALKQLEATARGLKSIKVNITGLTKASNDIRKLTGELNRLKAATAQVRVNTSGIAAATRQLNALRAQAARPINVAARAAVAPGARTAAGLGAGARLPATFGVHVLGGIVGLTAASMYGIASAIGRATREGVKDVDIGDTALTTLQLDRIAKETAEFNKTAPKDKQIPLGDTIKTATNEIERIRKAQEGTPGGALMNRGLISQTVAETLPLAGYDVKQAGWLAERQIEFIKMEV